MSIETIIETCDQCGKTTVVLAIESEDPYCCVLVCEDCTTTAFDHFVPRRPCRKPDKLPEVVPHVLVDEPELTSKLTDMPGVADFDLQQSERALIVSVVGGDRRAIEALTNPLIDRYERVHLIHQEAV